MAKQEEKKDIICFCTGTTKQKVIQLIEDGATDIAKISSATGAVTGCAGCDVSIMELLEEHASSS
ncbi:MAG: (2Fe-2S)-binding protein [Methylophagaceae bacterium]